MSVYGKYEAVIGLECHIQLLTRSKMYSSDVAAYGGLPNTNVSVVTLGHPGTLPVVNEQAVAFAVRLGIAVNANIREENEFARKNYFYADLPKGYQITQDKTPICTGGFIMAKLKNGEEIKVHLTRIHMEEDAGKSMHDIDPFETLVDLNRAGTPLLEIVTEPDLRNGEEAYAYLTEVRKLVRYLDICDGNMEEGSLRCDANISVMLKGSKVFGKKVEVKNMNSIRNVQRAIDHEIERQIEEIEKGNVIISETRNFDAGTGLTYGMRTKEELNDYRYFPDPDLSPMEVSDKWLNDIQATMPSLPRDLYNKYITQLNLPEYDAHVLTDSKDVALYFEELCKLTQNYKAASNWVMGPVKSYLNELSLSADEFPISPKVLVELITLVEGGKLNFSVASQRVFPE